MDKKILLQELSEGVARRKGLTKRDADTFVRTVFEVIEYHLKADKMVKIKGLGTFKLVSVDSRESVNVNTGERIQIKGHTKISFTPDAVLRDQINKPFAEFETVILHKDTDMEEMERVEVLPASDEVEVFPEENAVVADETPLEELAEESVEEVVVEVSAEVHPVPEEAVEEKEEVVEENTVNTPVNEVQTSEEPASPEDTPQEPVEEPETPQEETPEVAILEKTEETVPEKKATSGIRLSKLGIFGWLVLILCLMAGCYFVGYYRWASPCDSAPSETVLPCPAVPVKHTMQTTAKRDTVNVKGMSKDAPAKDSLKAEPAVSPDSVAKAPVQEVDVLVLAAQYDQVPDGKYLIIGTQGIHVVADGQTLRTIALAVYGSKGYASYIITHNRIENPDAIEPGMKLNLPKLKQRTE